MNSNWDDFNLNWANRNANSIIGVGVSLELLIFQMTIISTLIMSAYLFCKLFNHHQSIFQISSIIFWSETYFFLSISFVSSASLIKIRSISNFTFTFLSAVILWSVLPICAVSNNHSIISKVVFWYFSHKLYLSCLSIEFLYKLKVLYN